MATVHKFEYPEIWPGPTALPEIYPLTFEEPIAKDFHYKGQIGGTCGSIMDDIAEGFGRGSNREFVHYLSTAKEEAEELKSQLYRGLDVHYFSEALFRERYSNVALLIKKNGAFISHLNSSDIRGKKFKEKN